MKLIKQFSKDFQEFTGIKVTTLEEKHYPHWKRLMLPMLNPTQISTIVEFVRFRFGYHSNSTKLGSYNGQFCLTADIQHLEKVYHGKA